MVITANHKGKGDVEVGIMVDRKEELEDVLCEMVSINETILETIPKITDDADMIKITLLEFLKHVEGVLEKC